MTLPVIVYHNFRIFFVYLIGAMHCNPLTVTFWVTGSTMASGLMSFAEGIFDVTGLSPLTLSCTSIESFLSSLLTAERALL